MRVLLSLVFLPLLALLAGLGLVMGERELTSPDQAAAIGAEVTILGQPYAPIEILGVASGKPLLLETPLEVSMAQIIRPTNIKLRDMTTGQSGRRVISVTVPTGTPNVVLLVPLEGVTTAGDISLMTQSVLDPGPFKDLGFGFFSGNEMQRAASVAVVTLAALLIFWLPSMISGGLLRRRVRKVQEDVEDERIRAARSQKEAKAAANRADERVAEIEAHAHTREEEARAAIATAARAETNGSDTGEAAFWRDAVRDFLLAGNVGRDDVERMLTAISGKVQSESAPESTPEPESEVETPTQSAPDERSPLIATPLEDDGDDPGEGDGKPGLLGRRRRRR